MNYREVTPDDMPAIFDVRIRTWHNPNGKEELECMGITRRSVREMLKSFHRGWLCETEGEIIGFAIGNKETAEMWVIAVLKEFEGKGIGGTLLTMIEDWLASEGIKESWLTTYPTEGTRAIGFYHHQGWERWKLQDGNLYMKKNIEQRQRTPIHYRALSRNFNDNYEP